MAELLVLRSPINKLNPMETLVRNHLILMISRSDMENLAACLQMVLTTRGTFLEPRCNQRPLLSRVAVSLKSRTT